MTRQASPALAAPARGALTIRPSARAMTFTREESCNSAGVAANAPSAPMASEQRM